MKKKNIALGATLLFLATKYATAKTVMQDDPELPEEVQSWGCYYLSMLGIAENELGIKLTAQQIKDISEIVIDAGYMREDCTLIKPFQITNTVLTMYGIEKKIYDVGSKIPGEEAVYWGWVESSPEYKVSDYQVEHWEMSTGAEHYILKKNGTVIKDSAPGQKNELIKTILFSFVEDGE